jgi:hemoglobin
MAEELFDRLGGATAISRIVDRMYTLVIADETLKPFFENVQLDRLRRMQFEFIASALGGPISYSGAELQAVHAGRGIEAKHFTRFVNHLATAMEEQGAAQHDIDDMLGKIAMFRDRVIGSANVDG